MGQQLDRSCYVAGGSIAVTAVTRDIVSAFPDVAASSIKTNLSAPGFVIEQGVVRRRMEADRWLATAPLNAVRGAFRNGGNEVRVAVPVDRDLLRGSGQRMASAVAVALGVRPNRPRTLTSRHGDLTLTWLPSSTTGATMGSMRTLALTLGTGRGDTIVLIFDTRDGMLDLRRIRADDDAPQRLRLLLGRRVTDPVAALARGLGCKREDVSTVLRRRGEEHLIALLEEAHRAGTSAKSGGRRAPRLNTSPRQLPSARE